MFDTHCHLNFSRFKKNVDEVIQRAKDAGVTHFVIPGTDIESSKKAIELSEKYKNIYAAVGIHPHHIFPNNSNPNHFNELNHCSILSELVTHPKVVAVGEIGLDKHEYKATKYENYSVTPEFFSTQKKMFLLQLQIALTSQKSLIIHNRETADDLLELLTDNWDNHFNRRTVFHCCEPNDKLLDFAKKHHIFIGVDGDVTYDEKKQEFVKKIPLELLVVETDSPFLLPEPLRTQKQYPNEPKNIPVIISKIAELKNTSIDEIQKHTLQNSHTLFHTL